MSHVYKHIKFIMSIYNISQKNKAVIRSDKAYFDDGAYVWDEPTNKWISLAESNQVLSYDYLKNNSIQMNTDTTSNNLSSNFLKFNSTVNNIKENSTLTADNLVISSGADTNTLTATTIELADDYKNDLNISAGAINMNSYGSSDTNPYLKLTYQGITSTSLMYGTTQLTSNGVTVSDNQSDILNLSPAEINLTNGSKQSMDITPVQVSINGADNTSVDLQSSFIKINNSSGKTVTNLSQTGLVLSNGSSSTTIDGSTITCSGNVNGGKFLVSSGTSAFSTDESTLQLTNSVDNSKCSLQSSSISLSNKNNNTNLSLDGSTLVKADIDKLHNLPSTIPSYTQPITYYDSTTYGIGSYQVGGTITDHNYYYKPSSGTQFNVGDMIQLTMNSDIVKGSTAFAAGIIYLPFNNEFNIVGYNNRPVSLFSSDKLGSTQDLQFPKLTVRSYNLNNNPNFNGVPYLAYYFIFDGFDAGADVSVNYTINIQCIGNVRASTNGTSISRLSPP